MVHLAAIPASGEVDPAAGGLRRNATLYLSNDNDSYTTSVYGSRFASQDLPTTEMPEDEMPREVAYRMIKDELSLDGNPILKCVFQEQSIPQHRVLITCRASTVLHPLSPPTWYVHNMARG